MMKESLTKEERERRLKRKAMQLYYGKLLTEAFDEGQLHEMIEKLKALAERARVEKLKALSGEQGEDSPGQKREDIDENKDENEGNPSTL